MLDGTQTVPNIDISEKAKSTIFRGFVKYVGAILICS